ncbi:BTAD domain-containing putative transcriptional regulator [Streptomyces sp. NPDC057623]|uniref:AfsR/SARP family transcriptional regulator n=1 Tax=Streptomyces sp. NPDC057623 TaxID=3346187 RepID=UPI00369F5737
MLVAAATHDEGEQRTAAAPAPLSPAPARLPEANRSAERRSATPYGHVPRVPEQQRPGSEEPATLRFSVLGPVRAWRGDEPLPTGSPQQRALLATLLLRAGRTATAGELIDALWGEDPPTQALAAVRTYASRLRKVLSPGILVSESGGYAIRGLAEGALDLAVAQELAADAERAKGTRDLEHARALLHRALSLWDGETLAGIPGPYAEMQRAWLEEWHLELLESRLDMDLEQGYHAEAISELTALTAAYPLRERLRELLMLALYRSGRRAEALAVYADSRRLLSEELGVDPRPSLRDLQQRILRADADLAEPSAGVPDPAATPRPTQLPATVRDFTGRASFISELSEALASAANGVMAVSTLAGIGGAGKTTLAVQVAHQARGAFPDGQLYVDLQGAGSRPAGPETVLGSFLRALGTPDSAIPDSLEERAALYRSVLDGRRVFVLLDNAKDAAQVRPLLPGTEGCAALVTSRVRMVDLAGAHLVDLDVMSPAEALQLFTKIVGADRVASEREATLDVVAACGFLPLAIRIAASRLVARRTWTVSVLAAKLADERRRLDELQAGDWAVGATFELGYGQLEPAQARACRLLGLPDGPDISLPAAAALLDLPVGATEGLLESLVNVSLLESAGPGRYRYHQLVRLYARACAERDEQPSSERESALSRLLDFYLATVARAYAINRPGDILVDRLAPRSVPGLDFIAPATALNWFDTERGNLLACARQSTSTLALRRATDLLWCTLALDEPGTGFEEYKSGTAFWEYESAARVLGDAAREHDDAHADARVLVTLSTAHHFAGRLDEADRDAEHAMVLADAVQDRLARCWAANTRGLIAVQQQRFTDSEIHLMQAAEGSRAIGSLPGEASALCSLSRVYVATGRMERAVTLAQQGVAIYEQLGDVAHAANGRYVLGLALRAAGRLHEADAELQRALAVFRDNRQQLWQGTTHFRIAEAHLSASQPALAAQHAEQALALGCTGGEVVRAQVLTTLGNALNALGQLVRAQACWYDALSILEQAESPQAAELRALIQSRVSA